MMTWTCVGFTGRWPVGTSAIVTADNSKMACKLLMEELARIGLRQEINPEMLIPVVTNHRWVRILQDGDY